MDVEQELTFRTAGSHDCDLVVLLLSELIDELGPSDMAERVKPLLNDDIRDALVCPTVRIFIAECDAEAVGLSRGDVITTDPIFRLRDDHRCGYIDQMFVRAAYRDRGVGAQLLRLCEDWFRQQGIGHCLLHAAPKAVRFYARIGYQPNREMFKKL